MKLFQFIIYIYIYAGYDCTKKWATYLGDPARVASMATRLSEALGFTEAEITLGRERDLMPLSGRTEM